MTEIRLSRTERHVKKSLFSNLFDTLKRIDYVGIAMYLVFAIVVCSGLFYFFS